MQVCAGIHTNYLAIKNLSLDPQGSVLASELDPQVMLPAGIPTGVPAGNLYGSTPVLSLSRERLHTKARFQFHRDFFTCCLFGDY